jgi:hypothetical protein
MSLKSPYTHATYQAIQFKWTFDYNGHNCNNYDCTNTLTQNNIFPYMKHLATCKLFFDGSCINNCIGSLLLNDTWHIVTEIQLKPYP